MGEGEIRVRMRCNSCFSIEVVCGDEAMFYGCFWTRDHGQGHCRRIQDYDRIHDRLGSLERVFKTSGFYAVSVGIQSMFRDIYGSEAIATNVLIPCVGEQSFGRNSLLR